MGLSATAAQMIIARRFIVRSLVPPPALCYFLGGESMREKKAHVRLQAIFFRQTDCSIPPDDKSGSFTYMKSLQNAINC